jgi:hypothetical protein
MTENRALAEQLVDTSANHADAPPSTWELWRPVVMDIVSPFITYALALAFGVGLVWAMTAAGVVAALSTLFNTLRKRAVDAVGLLVMVELIAALALALFVQSPRLLLVRPSIYTAIASAYALGSVVIGRPVSYAGSRPMVARGGAARLAAYARAWKSSGAFRRSHQLVTFAFGICLAIDSGLRVFIVYTCDIERSAWLSKLPHLGATLIMIGVSALAGRRFSRLVNEHM